jgi:hypothetical protein
LREPGLPTVVEIVLEGVLGVLGAAAGRGVSPLPSDEAGGAARLL